ncbi:MAG: rhomboid family intramembrane serine protease [Rhizomicrobium sp.]
MIPISDDNPAGQPAYVTWGIIVACSAIYLWERSLRGEMNAALLVLGFTPAEYFAGGTRPAGTAVSPVWTIFTSMFLHGGILHLGGNMLYLWIFGNNVEVAFGHVRFLVFYFLSGVAAALTMAFVAPTSHVPMIGASGAISGVLAAYLLLFPRARVTVIVPLGIIPYPLAIAAMWVIGFWFLMQLISAGLANPGQPGTAWWAHVGGFAAGLLLTPLLKPRQRRLFSDIRRGPWDQ